MFFLMNDVVLSVDLQQMTPPLIANRFSALSLECVLGLGREIFAEEPQLQRQRLERAKRLACLIIPKAPEVNAALFAAPARGCDPERVGVRVASLDLEVLAQLHHDQQTGKLTPIMADQLVWARAAA